MKVRVVLTISIFIFASCFDRKPLGITSEFIQYEEKQAEHWDISIYSIPAEDSLKLELISPIGNDQRLVTRLEVLDRNFGGPYFFDSLSERSEEKYQWFFPQNRFRNFACDDFRHSASKILSNNTFYRVYFEDEEYDYVIIYFDCSVGVVVKGWGRFKRTPPMNW